MASREDPKIDWERVYPSLQREELREAQTRFCRYLEIVFQIVQANGAVDRAIDTDQPIFIIKERSNRNKN